MLKALPVYKAVKDLRKVLYRHIKSFPTYVKHPLGTLMVEELFKCIRLLAIVSTSHDDAEKLRCISEFLLEFDVLTDQIEFIVDERVISIEQSANLYLAMEKIEKQLVGFKKYLQNNHTEETPEQTLVSMEEQIRDLRKRLQDRQSSMPTG